MTENDRSKTENVAAVAAADAVAEQAAALAVAPLKLSPEDREVCQAAPWRRRFVTALASGVTVSRAAALADVPLSTAKLHRKTDAAFKRLWETAYEIGSDRCEDIAFFWATAGMLEPIWSHGKIVGWKAVKSERMLELILKKRKPAEFRENARVEHAGKVPGADAVSPAVAKLIDAALQVGARAPALALPSQENKDAEGGNESTREPDGRTVH